MFTRMMVEEEVPVKGVDPSRSDFCTSLFSELVIHRENFVVSRTSLLLILFTSLDLHFELSKKNSSEDCEGKLEE